MQYLTIKNYKKNSITNNVQDFENDLTAAEKVLTTKYKRVVNNGKGSRAVVILIPIILQNFLKTLIKCRENFIPKDEYVFAIPGNSIKWRKRDVSIRKLTKKIDLKNPIAISSNKLRKQIATVMQILNLSEEYKQFMGHTQKTHNEFYE